MQRTAIVGFGCAGYHAAKALRAHGYGGEIHIFSNTGDPPANPMLTTYYVSDRLPHSGMFPFGSLDQIQKNLSLTLHRETVVTDLDAHSRRLILGDGRTAVFDHIVLTTGASAMIPSIPGVDCGGVFCMRTVQDAELLRERLDRGVKSAVVIGASMVGIKLVELLYRRGISVTLADMAAHLFPTAALPEVARELEERVEKRGISLRFSSAIQGIEAKGGGYSVLLGDGSSLSCDLVLLCIGTQANTQLAKNPIAVKRGIVVNERMETTAPGIYAAGDCCEGNNLLSGQTQIIGLWESAARQGHTAGANIAGGTHVSYPGGIPHNITHFMDMDFIGLGDNRLACETRTFRLAGGRVDLAETDGRLTCVNILDSYRVSGVLKRYFLKRLAEPDARLDDVGRGWLEREGLPAHLIAYLEGLK